jgi:putative transposase
MTQYRRHFQPGGSYFFTVNLANRRQRLLTDHIDELRAAFRYTLDRHPFTIDAVVVLPEHLHAIWSLPPGDADYSTRWRLIKSHFSRALPVTECRSASLVVRSAKTMTLNGVFFRHALLQSLAVYPIRLGVCA